MSLVTNGEFTTGTGSTDDVMHLHFTSDMTRDGQQPVHTCTLDVTLAASTHSRGTDTKSRTFCFRVSSRSISSISTSVIPSRTRPSRGAPPPRSSSSRAATADLGPRCRPVMPCGEHFVVCQPGIGVRMHGKPQCAMVICGCSTAHLVNLQHGYVCRHNNIMLVYKIVLGGMLTSYSAV